MRSLLSFISIIIFSTAQAADCDGVTCGSGANAFVDSNIVTSLENLGIKVNGPTARRQTLPQESQRQEDPFAQDDSQSPNPGGGAGGGGGSGGGDTAGSGIEATTPEIAGSTPQIGNFDNPDHGNDENDSLTKLGQDSFDTLQPIIDPENPSDSGTKTASTDRAMRLGNLVYSGGQEPELGAPNGGTTGSDAEKASLEKSGKSGDEYFGDLGGGGGGSGSSRHGIYNGPNDRRRRGDRRLAGLDPKDKDYKNMFNGKLNFNQRSIASYQGSIFGLMCIHYNQYTKKNGFKERKTNCPQN